ncbi:recombinase, partial [Streptococcus suis]
MDKCESSMRELEEECQRQGSCVKHLLMCQDKALLSSELLNVLIERIEVDVDNSVTVTFT